MIILWPSSEAFHQSQRKCGSMGRKTPRIAPITRRVTRNYVKVELRQSPLSSHHLPVTASSFIQSMAAFAPATNFEGLFTFKPTRAGFHNPETQRPQILRCCSGFADRRPCWFRRRSGYESLFRQGILRTKKMTKYSAVTQKMAERSRVGIFEFTNE